MAEETLEQLISDANDPNLAETTSINGEESDKEDEEEGEVEEDGEGQDGYQEDYSEVASDGSLL